MAKTGHSLVESLEITNQMVSKVQKALDPKDGNKNTDNKTTNEEKESKRSENQRLGLEI